MSKSKQLNREKRYHIRKKAISDVFGARDRRLVETKIELAFAIRNESLAKRGLLEHVGALPSSLVHAKPRLKVVFGDGSDEVTELPFDSQNPGWGPSSKVYAAPRDGVDLAEASKQTQGKFHAMRQEEQRIKDLKDDLAATLDGLLWSVNTTKQLLEEWPEAEKYLPEDQQTPQVPAVRGEEVTAKINQIAAQSGDG